MKNLQLLETDDIIQKGDLRITYPIAGMDFQSLGPVPQDWVGKKLKKHQLVFRPEPKSENILAKD